MMILRRFLALTALLGLLGVGASGCKQANGERCQVPSDCESGKCLVTTGLEGICFDGTNIPIDSSVPTVDAAMVLDSAVPDARVVDAELIDASTD